MHSFFLFLVFPPPFFSILANQIKAKPSLIVFKLTSGKRGNSCPERRSHLQDVFLDTTIRIKIMVSCLFRFSFFQRQQCFILVSRESKIGFFLRRKHITLSYLRLLDLYFLELNEYQQSRYFSCRSVLLKQSFQTIKFKVCGEKFDSECKLFNHVDNSTGKRIK